MKEPNHEYIAGLVIRSQNNDSDAFAEIYSLTYNKVYNYACHYLKDTYLAQDAVQEVFISALKNISKINNPKLFIAWLNQISFHVCFDLKKRKNEKYGIVDDEILELFSDDHVYETPEDHALKSDIARRLTDAVNKLPPLDKELIILKYYNNMKLDDIANATLVSKSTVKRHLVTAQKILSELMKE